MHLSIFYRFHVFRLRNSLVKDFERLFSKFLAFFGSGDNMVCELSSRSSDGSLVAGSDDDKDSVFM